MTPRRPVERNPRDAWHVLTGMEKPERDVSFGGLVGVAILILFIGLMAILTLVVPSAADSGCGGSAAP
jgi:hypothetical protein